VTLLNSYVPPTGFQYPLVAYGSRQGQFDTVDLPTFSGGAFVSQYDDVNRTFSIQAVSA
jgi:hypothetical protein